MSFENFNTESLIQKGSGIFMSTLLADCLVLAFITFFIFSAIYPRAQSLMNFRKMMNAVGGPKQHWFWGDVKKYGFTNDGMYNLLKRTIDFPAMSSYYVGNLGSVQLYHPDVVKTIVTKNFPKAVGYKIFLAPFLRKGLITSDGALWKRHRRLLTAVFHFNILKEHCRIFNKNSRDVLAELDKIAQTNKSEDVYALISSSSYANMMECVMSRNKDQTSVSENEQLIKNIQAVSFGIIERQQNVFYWWIPLYNRTESGRRVNKARLNISRQADKIIKERRSLLQSMRDSNLATETNVLTDKVTGTTVTYHNQKGKKMDFLDLLLQTTDQDGNGLSDDEVYDEVVTFFAAGVETVTNGAGWTLFNLSKYPEIQERCRKEIQLVFGDKEEYEISDLSNLTYLTQCIKESMRLYPPIHTIGKQLDSDVVFSHRFNNYKSIKVNKGTNVTISIFALHRNPYVWENPEVFDPERFNTENASKIPPFAYIPFSAGPRNCIGQNFAMVQMKVLLSKILNNFELSWDSKNPHPSLHPGAALAPKEGMRMFVNRISHLQKGFK